MNLLQELQGASDIAIGGHIRPDGDCVGAVMAMYLYLTKVLPGARITAYLEEPAAVFQELKGIGQISTTADENEKPDVFLILDCTKDRLGFSEVLCDNAGKTINIDHHISNGGCGDVNYIVPTASATSELVFDLIGEENLDKDITEALYIGIIHDTGVLQYSNTSPKTLRTVARLIEFGFDFNRIIDKTFYEKTYVQTQILGRALLESFLFMGGRCIVSAVSRKEMQFYGVTPKDLDGIVNQLRNIKDVDCAIFMYETDVLEYKVSMRSNGRVNVSEVAVLFGGGGHVRAAGCTMKGTMHDVVNNLSLHIEKQLSEAGEL